MRRAEGEFKKRADKNSTHDIESGHRFGHRRRGLADKLDADAVFVMARDAARHLGNENEFADHRPDVGLERYAAHRNIHHFAWHDLAIGAGEFGEALLMGALMA